MAMKCYNCKQVELAYKKGMGEGYKQGNRDGRKEGEQIRKEADIMVYDDLQYFYAKLAVTLKKKRRWKDETIMLLLKQMLEVGESTENIYDECYRLTGIEFRQHEGEGKDYFEDGGEYVEKSN